MSDNLASMHQGCWNKNKEDVARSRLVQITEEFWPHLPHKPHLPPDLACLTNQAILFNLS